MRLVSVAGAALSALAGLSVCAEVRAQSIEEVRRLNYVVLVDAACDAPVEDWSLLADFSRGSDAAPWLLRSTLQSMFVRFNAPQLKGGGKQGEPSLVLMLALIVRAPDWPPEVPATVDLVVLDRSTQKPKGVSGLCADNDGDGIIMTFECDQATEDALLGVFREQRTAHQSELYADAVETNDLQLGLRACVEAQSGSSVPGDGLAALVGSGIAVLQH